VHHHQPSSHHPYAHPYAMAVGSIRREGHGANGTRDGGHTLPWPTPPPASPLRMEVATTMLILLCIPQLMAVSWPPAHCTYSSTTTTGISILPSAGLHAVHGHQQGHGDGGYVVWGLPGDERVHRGAVCPPCLPKQHPCTGGHLVAATMEDHSSRAAIVSSGGGEQGARCNGRGPSHPSGR